MPTVSILTPVYNGERYLEACIESVLAQTYDDFEYVILDNCSTDRTPEIISRYTTDKRVRVFRNDHLVPVMANYNRVGSLASADARYLKYVAADDLLFPDCVKSMVDVAEAHPDVGLVASYKIHGRHVVSDAPPYPDEVVDGRVVCKWFFQGRLGVLGSPSNHLIRRSILRPDKDIFDDDFLHSDTELFVRLLKDGRSYGFVHQVLTFTREHAEALSTSFSDRMGTRPLEFLVTLVRHGRSFLSADEFNALENSYRRKYARGLCRMWLKPWDREVWRYQTERRAQLALQIGPADLLRAFVWELASIVRAPGSAIESLRREYRRVSR
jgi:glycosyltransferase involved in cell wall biosynthesis